jgi:hypothetical protein
MVVIVARTGARTNARVPLQGDQSQTSRQDLAKNTGAGNKYRRGGL